MRVQDQRGRFTKSEVAKILSTTNRRECREKLNRTVTTEDLIEHWLDKHIVAQCVSSQKAG